MPTESQTTPAPHCCEADRLLVHALDGASKALALAAVYEKALRFYADPMNWSVDGTICAASPESVFRPDCGDTAREALAHGR